MGTTGPLEKLSVTGNISLTDTDGNGIVLYEASNGNDYAKIANVVEGNGTAGIRFFTTASDTTGTERVRIAGTGNVGIGTGSPSYTLHVNGSVAGTSAYNNLSDARLKKNVAPIGNALEMLQKIRGVRYQWRKPEERKVGKGLSLPGNEVEIGFIAQDIKAVLPEAVSTAAGNEKILSVKKSKLVPVLVEAVKEQQAEILALKSENAKLRDANVSFKAQHLIHARQSTELAARLARLENVSFARSR